MATIIYSDKQAKELMLGIGDKRDRNTRVKIVLGIGCDDIQTLPDEDTHPDESTDGSKLTIYDGGYGDRTHECSIDIYSLEPLGVLKWLDDLRNIIATSACYYYHNLKRDVAQDARRAAQRGDEAVEAWVKEEEKATADALAKFEHGSAYNGYRMVEDEDANGGYRLETLPFDEWYAIRNPDTVGK